MEDNKNWYGTFVELGPDIKMIDNMGECKCIDNCSSDVANATYVNKNNERINFYQCDKCERNDWRAEIEFVIDTMGEIQRTSVTKQLNQETMDN